MKQRRRIYYSTEQRAEIWDRWKRGESGSNASFIATLVERHSRYVMLVKVPSKDTLTVVNALIKHSKKLPTELYKSLTWDRGKELADHKRFTLKTNIDVFFCDPQSPWQRGTSPKAQTYPSIVKQIKCGSKIPQRTS